MCNVITGSGVVLADEVNKRKTNIRARGRTLLTNKGLRKWRHTHHLDRGKADSGAYACMLVCHRVSR